MADDDYQASWMDWRKEGDKDPTSGGREERRYKERTNRDLVSVQERVIKEQDNGLEHLSKTLLLQKHVANEIGDEIDIQKHLIDDLDTHTEKSNKKIKKEQKRLNKLAKRATWPTCLICCVALLVIILLIVAVVAIFAATDWGCKIVSIGYCDKSKDDSGKK